MNSCHQHNTSIATPFGLFEYTRMPFGSAPSSFQCFMQQKFNDAVFKFTLEDVIIYLETGDGHLERLDIVFTPL